MSRRLALYAVGALFLCSLASTVRGDATSDVRKQIQAAYNAENAAAAKKNVQALFAHTAPDFVATTSKGQKITLQQYRTMIPRMLAAMRDIKASTTVKKIVLKGKTAVATVDERMEATLMAPAPGQTQPKASKLVVTDTSEDTWVKSPKGWMKKSSHTLTENQTLNGKPMPGG